MKRRIPLAIAIASPTLAVDTFYLGARKIGSASVAPWAAPAPWSALIRDTY